MVFDANGKKTIAGFLSLFTNFQLLNTKNILFEGFNLVSY